MGEFSRPGSYSVKRDRVSVLDAIGMAGDLPLTANRKNILVIRDNNGLKETCRWILQPKHIRIAIFFI